MVVSKNSVSVCPVFVHALFVVFLIDATAGFPGAGRFLYQSDPFLWVSFDAQFFLVLCRSFVIISLCRFF